MGKTKLSHKLYRELLFWVGIIATLAYRIIIILNNYSPIWVEIAWYIGTIGFIWYFLHRYQIANKREKLVESQNLNNKITNCTELSKEDKDAIVYILKGLRTSKARWNYIAIFAFSLIALIYDIIDKIFIK